MRTNPEVCRAHALQCKQQALLVPDRELRQHYLDMAAAWSELEGLVIRLEAERLKTRLYLKNGGPPEASDPSGHLG